MGITSFATGPRAIVEVDPPADFAYGAATGAGPVANAATLAIFADRPHVRQQIREDALMSGFRVAECAALDVLRAENACPSAEVVLVDCPLPDAASLAALARLDMRAAKVGTQLIVATRAAGLEDVFGCLDQSQPQLLVDASPADLALALARAQVLAPGRNVREMADEDRMQLMRLTEQVGRLAARLGGTECSRVEAPALAFRAAPQEDDRLVAPARAELPDPRVVRRILRQRQQRAQFFDGELFADPAWDMLLDLTAARAEDKRVSVTSLCIAAGVPPTTALRWIGQLQHAGLFERVEDQTDRRRAFIGLTDKAAEGMTRFFVAVAPQGSGGPVPI